MKDPSGQHFETDYDGEKVSRCDWDGKKFPCKTVRKWRATPEFRLQELEAKVERLGLSNAGLRREGSDLRKQLYEVDMIVNGGLVLAVADLLNRQPGGMLTVARTIDSDDLTDFSSTYQRIVPRREEFTVEYKSPDGSLWKNKQLIERTFDKR